MSVQAADWFTQGVQAVQREDYVQAAQAFTKAIETQDHPGSALANRCLVNIQLQNYVGAIADCTQVLQLQPNNKEAYLNRGLAYYRSGEFQAAVDDNTHLIKLQPDDFRAYFNRGLAMAALGNYKQAIAEYDQAMTLTSDTEPILIADMHTDGGLAKFELKDMSGAIADSDAAIQLNAHNHRAYYNRGCMHGRQGNYTAAIRDFTQALALNPDNPEAHLDRGVAHYNLGDAQQALNDLQEAAKAFLAQGKATAYQRTVNLIKQVQKSQEPVFT